MLNSQDFNTSNQRELASFLENHHISARDLIARFFLKIENLIIDEINNTSLSAPNIVDEKIRTAIHNSEQIVELILLKELLTNEQCTAIFILLNLDHGFTSINNEPSNGDLYEILISFTIDEDDSEDDIEDNSEDEKSEQKPDVYADIQCIITLYRSMISNISYILTQQAHSRAKHPEPTRSAMLTIFIEFIKTQLSAEDKNHTQPSKKREYDEIASQVTWRRPRIDSV